MPSSATPARRSGRRDRAVVGRASSMTISKSPDGDFQLQFRMEAFANSGADEVKEPQNVAGRGAGLGDDEVSVAIADFRAAHLDFGEPRLLDEGGGAEAPRVAENPRRGLKAQR